MIVLVAVVMLFVVGAMAAISIDVVTLYTARSEAQLAADSAALAAARVLTSSQVTFPNGPGGTNNSSNTNPTVTVQVQVKTLPAFFSRIWGNTQLAVSASATAEAYNPSPVSTSSDVTQPPVAPLCVKPWLLPNIDPNIQTQPIFAPTTGAIQDSALLGWQTQDVNNPASGTYLKTACTGGNCTPLPNPPLTSWLYLPGSPTSLRPALRRCPVTAAPDSHPIS